MIDFWGFRRSDILTAIFFGGGGGGGHSGQKYQKGCKKFFFSKLVKKCK
jgi:hypothetical protein